MLAGAKKRGMPGDKEKLLRLYRERLRHFLCQTLIELPTEPGCLASLRKCAIQYLGPQDWEDVCLNRASLGYCGWIQCQRPPTGRLTIGQLNLLIDKRLDKDVVKCLCSIDCLENFIAVNNQLNAQNCQFRTPPECLVQLYEQSLGTRAPPQPLLVELQEEATTTSSSETSKDLHSLYSTQPQADLQLSHVNGTNLDSTPQLSNNQSTTTPKRTDDFSDFKEPFEVSQAAFTEFERFLKSRDSKRTVSSQGKSAVKKDPQPKKDIENNKPPTKSSTVSPPNRPTSILKKPGAPRNVTRRASFGSIVLEERDGDVNDGTLEFFDEEGMKDLEKAIMSGEEGSLDLDLGIVLPTGKEPSTLEMAVKRTVGKFISWISPQETAGFVLFGAVVPDNSAMNSDDAASVTTTDTLANDAFYDPIMEGEAGIDQTVPVQARRSVVADQLFQQNTNFGLANILLTLAPPFLATLRFDAVSRSHCWVG
eukprot:Protomagalhaensia_sp_Gyna_25__4278@NODE_38_length_6740_cov_65_576929_g27_i0_p1_GENE_NODE_38_length_6740_cov_65_576929_g27_i0NODE_38_length_6740_cov_65_576929_g27_i0_p1_ORF_typecomplete_len479_score69_39RPAP2_Rtr1/PF04181_13/2_6e06_NODE_38_length_6740_cov_65_576929_g27_i031804616